MTRPYKSALDRLDALVNEARWVLTDSELDRLKPVNREAPAEIEAAIRLISTELMPEDQLAADDPFAAHNLVVDWSTKPDMGLLQVMRDPTFLPFTVSQLFRKPDGSPIQLLPYQHVVLLTYFYKQMVLFLGSRGAAKTWILALYIVLKLTFHQGTEIAIVSKTLRQSKLVWSYAERLWNCSPVFRSLVGEGRNGPKAAMSEGKYVFIVGDSIAHFLPMGHDGEGLRGIRATVVASDEFGSLDPEVFAVVVQGFGAVSADPVFKVGERAKADIYKRLNLWTPEQQAGLDFISRGNQSIISGTATYAMGHFFTYWQSYKAVVESGGDPAKVRKIFGGDPPPGFDHRRYAVLRMPYDILPKDYLDEATIGRAKQLATSSEFLREYCCVFPRDSSGFFKRSNIERCTIGGLDLPPPEFASGIADFGVARAGDPVRQYVYGIDPAFANDNFAVVILELWPDHRRVVHCWTTRKAEHRAHEKRGKGVSSDFYQFAVDRLRALFAKFPPRAVVIDAQGGGRTIEEKFREPRPGEVAMYAHDDEEVLHLPGEHILHMFQFANANDVSEANWGLAKDLEARCLLFPRASGAEYALADEADRAGGYDEGGLEDVLGEIDELKNELTLIVCEPTANNARERWDLPESGAYARKDRYSALVMANLIARRIGAAVPTSERPDAYGGAVSELAARQEELGKSGASGPLYVMTKATDPKIRAGARGTWYAG